MKKPSKQQKSSLLTLVKKYLSGLMKRLSSTLTPVAILYWQSKGISTDVVNRKTRAARHRQSSTQKLVLRNYLSKNRIITVEQARHLKVYSLSQRICDLRHDGLDIITIRELVDGTSKKAYRLRTPTEKPADKQQTALFDDEHLNFLAQ